MSNTLVIMGIVVGVISVAEAIAYGTENQKKKTTSQMMLFWHKLQSRGCYQKLVLLVLI